MTLAIAVISATTTVLKCESNSFGGCKFQVFVLYELLLKLKKNLVKQTLLGETVTKNGGFLIYQPDKLQYKFV